jgi:hypothetical protein
MQPTIPSPEIIVFWINLLMTGKATAKEQELQVGDHSALSSSFYELRFTVHTQPPLFTPLHHNCCATYAHDDDKWRIMQGASSGHATIAASAVLSRGGAGADDAAGADET